MIYTCSRRLAVLSLRTYDLHLQLTAPRGLPARRLVAAHVLAADGFARSAPLAVLSLRMSCVRAVIVCIFLQLRTLHAFESGTAFWLKPANIGISDSFRFWMPAF